MDLRRRQRRYRIRWAKLLAAVGLLAAVTTAAVVIFRQPGMAKAKEAALFTDEAADVTAAASPAEKSGAPSAPEAEGLLILVNWDNPVPYERPENLAELKDIFGDEVGFVNPDGSINAEAGSAAKEMFVAAQAEGIGQYKLVSAYRSIAYQEKLWQARLAQDPGYGSDPYNNPVKVVPGKCSEHTTGLAIDILSESYGDSDEGYADTPEGKWLAANAYKFGFILRYPKDKEHITGVMFEPWHYRYVGRDAAKEIHDRGVCLEEYLGLTHQ
jgi:D-alanyl-D-alanine carboxypeptidase